MKVTNNIGAVYGSPEAPKKAPFLDISKSDVVEAQSDKKADCFDCELKIAKKAVWFDKATETVSFRGSQNDGITQVALTKENIDRLKQRFGDDLKWDGVCGYNLTGKAEKYISAFWEYHQEKQPDIDDNGLISRDEFIKSKSLLIGYDEESQAPVSVELTPIANEIDKIDDDLTYDKSIDELFNELIKFDENVDGIISKKELGENMTVNAGADMSRAKDVAMLRWLLWIAEGMEDEKKRNKNNVAKMDTENLRRTMFEKIDALPNVKNNSKLAELLQNLKGSLK